MPVDPGQVLIAVGGVVGATVLFGLLVSFGAALVRRLKLGQELPDGPRFEPPPPPLRRPDEDPRAIAERQSALRAAYVRGLVAHRAMLACNELVHALPAKRDGDVAAPAKAIERAAETATAAVDRALRAIAAGGPTLADEMAAAEAAATAALAEADAAALRLPPAPRWRRMLMVVLVALAIGCLVGAVVLQARR